MNRVQYLLTKLAEEASEISQIALKTQQFGLDEKLPGQDLTNCDRIEMEFNDLLGVIELLNQEFGCNIRQDDVAIKAKGEKINKYYQYSIECGQVNE